MSIATFNSEILPKSDFSVLVSTDLKSFGHWYPSITQSLSAIRPMHRSTSKLTSLDHSPYVPNTNASILPKDSKCSSHALVQNDGVATTAGIAGTAGTAATLLPNSSVVSGTIGLAAMAFFQRKLIFKLFTFSIS